jgi:hypothetical protein
MKRWFAAVAAVLAPATALPVLLCLLWRASSGVSRPALAAPPGSRPHGDEGPSHSCDYGEHRAHPESGQPISGIRQLVHALADPQVICAGTGGTGLRADAHGHT